LLHCTNVRVTVRKKKEKETLPVSEGTSVNDVDVSSVSLFV